MYSFVTYRLAPLLALLGLLSSCAVYDHVFHPHRLGNPPMTASAKAKAKAAEKARHKGTTLAALSAADETKTGATAAGGDAGAATPAPDEAKSAADKNKAIEDMLGNTYNTKTGLLKRNAIQRFQNNGRKLHHYAASSPQRTDANRDARHLRKHSKSPGKAKGEKDPAAPDKEADVAADPNFTPDPIQPAAPKATRPAKAAAPKTTKAPAPKTAKAPTPKATKAPAAKPKAKADKAKEAQLKDDKMRMGGEHVEKAAKPKKDKKAPKAPKPDPTQPLTGQD